jgi:HJR/Mrr/RecB family endonuclease
MDLAHYLATIFPGVSYDELDETEAVAQWGGLILPDGTSIDGDAFKEYLIDERSGDSEYEGVQDLFLFSGESQHELQMFRDLSWHIRKGNWRQALDLADELYGRVTDLQSDERLSPSNLDTFASIERIFDDIFSTLDFLIAADFSSIWSPRKTQILQHEVFREVDRRIAEGIVTNPKALESLDPRFFEDLVASIFSSMGFEVFLTARTRDGGRDIVAVGEKATILLKFIIECKRYRRTRKVSVSQVRELFGVKVSEGASKAILATTSMFTKDAQEFARRHIWDLQLIDFRQLLEMIRRYALGS